LALRLAHRHGAAAGADTTLRRVVVSGTASRAVAKATSIVAALALRIDDDAWRRQHPRLYQALWRRF